MTVRIAVLGATGATGRLLVDELVRRGHTVPALARNPQPGGPGAVTWVAGDARDPGALHTLVSGADAVVSALGGAGEMVSDPREIGPALDRAFDAGVPYLVNVITDVEAAYPRQSMGV